MNLLIKKIIPKEEVEVQLELPAYFKSICHNYKIVSEEEIWIVMKGHQNKEVRIELSNLRCYSLEYVMRQDTSNEDEFKSAYNEALEILKINE